jgi:type IV pilus assembly protein PilA
MPPAIAGSAGFGIVTHQENFMKRIQQGFTLIELMIVVAIIGILAAIAIPQYQNYTGRAQLSDAITIAGGLKTAVGEVYQVTGDITLADSNNLGIPDTITSNAGKFADSVAVADGVITVTMKASGVATCVQSATVTLTPTIPSVQDAPIAWTCTTSAAAGCKPASCQ